MSQRFSKSSSFLEGRPASSFSVGFLATTFVVGLAFSGSAAAQQGPTIPGDFSRPSYSKGATAPRASTTRVQPSTSSTEPYTNLNQRNVRSDSSITDARNRAKQDSQQCQPGKQGNTDLTFYNGTPVYPGPNVPLPTPGTYFYQSPYYGYGYGPNGYGYGYQPYNNYYYPNGYPARGYQR